MTARIRHIALSVPDPEATARFYETALGLTRVGANEHAGARAVYLTDGYINLALLRYKTDEAAGGDPDDFGVHHFGFTVEDPDAAGDAVKSAGGSWLMGEPKEEGVFYEVKYRDPDGAIFDINKTGWRTE